MATAEEYAQWIVNNSDKRGTPEFETVAKAYRDSMSAKQPESPKSQYKESWLDEVKGGLASGPINAYLGVKQMFGGLSPEEQKILQYNKEAEAKAPVSSIVGNAAMYAPLAFVPGANTVLGGAALGATTGAVQPTEEGGSRLANAVIGGALGGAAPALIRAGKVAKAALVDPFTNKGVDRIVGGLMNRSVSNPEAVARNLASAKGATQGFIPTVGMVAGDDGLASLERTVRAIDPKSFSQLGEKNRAALADALRNIAGDPVKRQALVDGREQAVEALYTAAKKANVTSDSILESLMQRPSMKSAVNRASEIASERGGRLLVSKASQPKTNLISMTTEVKPTVYSGDALHNIKMGLDDAIGVPGQGGMQGAERSAALSTKSDYLNWLESKIPEYGRAKSTYADMSKPINQMDIGQNLAERFIPALYRDMESPLQLNSAQLARALTDQGDDIARSVTGMKGATLEGVMSPEQMASLRGVLSDTQKMKILENAGRGAGSDTVQKAAMSHIAAEAGIPNWVSSVARVPGGWIKRAGDVVYGNADDTAKARLAEVLTNPEEAARIMQMSGMEQSKIAEALKMLAIGAGQTAAPLAAQ